MVSHIVYSDGLAAVSVLIEPMKKARIAHHLSHQGAVNIFTRPVSDFMVTVLGENARDAVAATSSATGGVGGGGGDSIEAGASLPHAATAAKKSEPRNTEGERRMDHVPKRWAMAARTRT